MDGKAGRGGAGRNGNNTTSHVTHPNPNAKKKRKARMKAATAASSSASASASAGTHSGKKITGNPNNSTIPTVVAVGKAAAGTKKNAIVSAQQTQQEPQSKKKRKRLHNGGKAAAAAAAAANAMTTANDNAGKSTIVIKTHGGGQMVVTGKNVAQLAAGSHKATAVAEPPPASVSLTATASSSSGGGAVGREKTKLTQKQKKQLRRAKSASEEHAGMQDAPKVHKQNPALSAGSSGVLASIPKIKVKRKIDEVHKSASVQGATTSPVQAGHSSASNVPSPVHADVAKQPALKKPKFVSTTAEAKQKKALSPSSKVPKATATLTSTRAPVTSTEPIAAPKQSTSPKPSSATASSAPHAVKEPVQDPGKPANSTVQSAQAAETKTDVSVSDAADIVQKAASTTAEPLVAHISKISAFIKPSIPEASVGEPPGALALPAETMQMTNPPVNEPTTISAIASETPPASPDKALSDESIANTPSPIAEFDDELRACSQPQLASPRIDEGASLAHEPSKPLESSTGKEDQSSEVCEVERKLLSDETCTLGEQTDDHISPAKHNLHQGDDEECKGEGSIQTGNTTAIVPQDAAKRREDKRSMQDIPTQPAVRTPPPKLELPPPRPENAWGASFGMTIAPERAPASLWTASSPAFATSPLSSWFLSKGQANFMQQVAFPPRAASERHRRRSVSPQKQMKQTQNTSSSLETALIANQEEDDEPLDASSNAFLDSLTQQSTWRTWYGSVDQKDLLDPPLERIPVELRNALDATTSRQLTVAPVNSSEQEVNESASKTAIDALEAEIRAEKDHANAFTHELLLMLQGKTLSGKSLEEEYSRLIANRAQSHHVQP